MTKNKKELLNALKKYNLVSLVKTQISKHKFNMLCTFDGTIVPGSIMTINQLAEIVTSGFAKVNNRLDNVEIALEDQKKFNEEQKKFNEDQKKFNEEQKKFNEDQKKFNEEQKKFNALVLKRLDEHEAIFKRNNLR